MGLLYIWLFKDLVSPRMRSARSCPGGVLLRNGGDDNPDQVLRPSKQFLHPLGGQLARFPKGRKGYNGRVDRGYRTDDEEFYRPYLPNLSRVSDFLTYAQRWSHFRNAFPPHFGANIDCRSPLAPPQDLSYTGHQAIAAFPPVVLDDMSTHLLMACDPKDGDDLSADHKALGNVIR